MFIGVVNECDTRYNFNAAVVGSHLNSLLSRSSVGWGKIKHPGSSHHILQQAKLPPVTNAVCAKKLAASPGKVSDVNQ